MEISKGLLNRHRVSGLRLEESLTPVYRLGCTEEDVAGKHLDVASAQEMNRAIEYLKANFQHHNRQARTIEVSWALYQLTGKVVEYTHLPGKQGTAKVGSWFAESYIASNYHRFSSLTEFKAHLNNLNAELFNSIINYKFHNYLTSIYAIKDFKYVSQNAND